MLKINSAIIFCASLACLKSLFKVMITVVFLFNELGNTYHVELVIKALK